MSIVIKGMRIPENCASCPFAERIPPGRTRCLLTCRLLAENYEAPSQLKRNEYCPIEERKTGKWIEITPEEGNDIYTVKCDQCGKYDFFETNFCSNCGAKMIGGEEG